jgi:hypothetical protein
MKFEPKSSVGEGLPHMGFNTTVVAEPRKSMDADILENASEPQVTEEDEIVFVQGRRFWYITAV